MEYHLQFRMAVCLCITGVIYGVLLGTATIYLGIPFWILIAALAVGLVGFYVLSVEMVLRTVNARKIPEDKAPNLTELVKETSERMGIPTPDIRVAEEDTPNSFSIGRQGNGTVVVTKELVELLEADELAAVLAHEMAHIKHRDVIPTSIGLSLPILFGYGLYRFENRFGEQKFLRKILIPIVNTFGFIFVFPIIRYREFVADKTSSEVVGSDSLASALEKIGEAHGYRSASSVPVISALFIYNTTESFHEQAFGFHPRIQTRIDRLKPLE